MTIINAVGYYGPITILALAQLFFKPATTTNTTSTTTSKPQQIFLFLFLWQLCSYMLNVIIKNAIQAPRPDSTPAQLTSALSLPYMQRHRFYGMPSGHAQSVFSTASLLVFSKNTPPLIKIIGVLQALITAWQRHATRRHSWSQIGIGAGLGCIMGYLGNRVYYTFHSSSSSVPSTKM